MSLNYGWLSRVHDLSSALIASMVKLCRFLIQNKCKRCIVLKTVICEVQVTKIPDLNVLVRIETFPIIVEFFSLFLFAK